MTLNKMFHDDIFVLAKTLLNLEVGDQKATFEDIEAVMKKVRFLQPKATKEIILMTKRRIEASVLVDMGVGDYITDNSHKPWFIDYKADKNLYYWERYRTLLSQKGFSKSVIMKMDNVSDRIVDLIGDPNSINMFTRRGLVIGDVQSGKTANYISAITKAADSGYKVIILLTGTLNTLRSQTQERIDEGFIGVDSSMLLEKKKFYIGVGKIDAERRPLSVTTLDDDFNLKTAKKLQVQLKDYKEPAIFVIKKNVSVLKNLSIWFDSSTSEIQRSKLPLLIIDDEADYASVNTSKEENSPSKTNKLIRGILEMFPKVCYVGFTATPFANVFINPEKPEDMQNDDLFPENFIYVLDSPTNYMGPEYFFDDENADSLIHIKDMESFLPHKHKIDYDFSEIPSSLNDALLLFLITNAIRDMRSDTFSHRTMLINITRFTNLQNNIAEHIGEIVYNWKRILKQYPYQKGMTGKPRHLYDEILDLYEKHYFNTYDYSPEDLLSVIGVSTQKILVTAVNSDNKADKVINYKIHKEKGLRVIAIGGITLSRGLTLEGLTVSYFYRNSRYYDTLMQMGRWFGYRPGYDDLCKVFMSEDAINWYGHIAEATEELKGEIRLMNSLDLTPKDFGLKVMSHPSTLLVTAPNKLRNAPIYVKNISLSEQVIETPRLCNNLEINSHNFELLNQFVNEISKNKPYELFGGKSPLFKEIDKSIVVNFIGKYKAHISNIHFQCREIAEYIDTNKKELELWDIVFISGESDQTYSFDNFEVIPSKRMFAVRDKEIIQISAQKNRLGSSTSTRAGLEQDIIDKIRKEHKELNEIRKLSNQKPLGESATLYTKKAPNRRPLLMVYIVDLVNSGKEFYKDLLIDDNRLTYGLGIAFPRMDDYKDKHFVEYRLNRIYYEQMFFDLDDYGQVEDSDD